MVDKDAMDFFKSYEAATRAGDATRLAAHYAEPYTSFTLGHVGVFLTRDDAVAAVTPHLKRLRDFGLDDVRLIDLAVTRISPAFRLCLPTWEIRPRDGTPAFTFLNVYGLREDERGHRFEFAVADNEAVILAERYPGAMPRG
jgi:ketosteroid isomerase-like protein